MEKETSSLVSLGIVLIAIAVVITLGFGIFAVGKRLANNGQNDLVSQADQINQSTFTDLDQQVITGTRLKGVINQLSSGNYAVLLNTLALRNNQADGATLTGDLATSINAGGGSYGLVATNYPSQSAKGTEITSTLFVNYNALMKNAQKPTALSDTAFGVTNPSGKQHVVVTGNGEGASDNLDSYKTLEMTDGVFETDLEFISDATTGNIQKNTKIADFTKQGTTMYIADAAQFNSYCIKDSTDNYVGLAFIQIQK